jgi:enoyl-CoA hydratase/carnithine racemase
MSVVSVQIAAGVASVVLDRPERRNALDRELVAELREALVSVARDREVSVVVLKGAGAGFSAGIDGGTLPALRTDEGLRTIRAEFVAAADPLETMRKPTIAQVHGWAFGAGFELALACDLRVIEVDAKLCLPETRMGLVPDVGGCARLSALCGVGRAKELILTSATIDGRTARELGIANRIAPAAELDAVTAQLVGELQQCSPVATGSAKRVIDLAAKPGHAAAMTAELEAQLGCIGSDWCRDAVAAYEARLRGGARV